MCEFILYGYKMNVFEKRTKFRKKIQSTAGVGHMRPPTTFIAPMQQKINVYINLYGYIRILAYGQ